MKLTKDSDGEPVRDGDLIRFSYGIPPVRVEARVVQRAGQLWALTAPHKPEVCRLSRLRGLVGCFYKIEGERTLDPREVEARIFAGRRALDTRGSE